MLTATLLFTSVAFAATGPPYKPSDWDMDFEDEFNSLNKTTWNLHNGTHAGNNEAEFYTPEQCSIRDGTLVQTAIAKETYGFNYTSCWVDTSKAPNGSASFTYGRFEINAKLPWSKSMWPAHWLLPLSGFCWPMGGEIDIMEAVAPDANQVHAAVHYSESQDWSPCGNSNHGPGNFSEVIPEGAPKFNETFTTFGVEWDLDSLVFYWNETSYLTLPLPQEHFVQSKFYMILNLAVGGGWPGYPDNTTVFPQEHVIDWVRHYKRN